MLFFCTLFCCFICFFGNKKAIILYFRCKLLIYCYLVAPVVWIVTAGGVPPPLELLMLSLFLNILCLFMCFCCVKKLCDKSAATLYNNIVIIFFSFSLPLLNRGREEKRK